MPLIKSRADTEQMERCWASAIGQCLYYGHARAPHTPPFIQQASLTLEQIEAVARHITAFTLAGIENIRKANEKRVGAK